MFLQEICLILLFESIKADVDVISVPVLHIYSLLLCQLELNICVWTYLKTTIFFYNTTIYCSCFFNVAVLRRVKKMALFE